MHICTSPAALRRDKDPRGLIDGREKIETKNKTNNTQQKTLYDEHLLVNFINYVLCCCVVCVDVFVCQRLMPSGVFSASFLVLCFVVLVLFRFSPLLVLGPFDWASLAGFLGSWLCKVTICPTIL